jgi:hypothetical protein
MRRPHFEISDPGQGATAFVHTRVELFYRRFLEEVEVEHNNDKDLFDAHLKAIIWGVLYIEGLVNYKLFAFTARRFQERELADSYWELTKQARLVDKLNLVFASDRAIRPGRKDLQKNFMRMVDERNRLVHFKEVPTPFDLPALVAKLGINASSPKWSEHTPYPKVVTDILVTPLEERLKTFLSLGNTLELVGERA